MKFPYAQSDSFIQSYVARAQPSTRLQGTSPYQLIFVRFLRNHTAYFVSGFPHIWFLHVIKTSHVTYLAIFADWPILASYIYLRSIPDFLHFSIWLHSWIKLEAKFEVPCRLALVVCGGNEEITMESGDNFLIIELARLFSSQCGPKDATKLIIKSSTQ